jgi:hypothetical protein
MWSSALVLSWSNYAPAQGVVASLTPCTVVVGETTCVRARGKCAVDIARGTYRITVMSTTLTPFTILTQTGDLFRSCQVALPLRMGTLHWHGLAQPTRAGDVHVDADVFLSRWLPSWLCATTMTIDAEAEDGTPLLRLRVDLRPVSR